MAKTITGVPESITRDQYLSLINSVGFDANEIRELTFATDGIHAEVFERDTNGHPRIDDDGMSVVINSVFIPVEDGK